jgi:magnesium chelatase subunit I
MKKFSQLIRHPGNIPLFDIIDISILGALSGTPVHFHAEGLRGTGKTTIIRVSKQILPKIERIKGCMFNCDPNKPHCPEHKYLSQKVINEIGIETINMPFLEISPSAKKGTVVGSIDIKKILSREKPESALLLGTIPKAHRGIIFVDEINRIADISPEIADILLDVMGTKPGRIQIEEIGFPVLEVPIQVCIWAASNPDEDPGPLEDIRRQLSDRFDYTVNVERPTDINAVKAILDYKNQEGNSEDTDAKHINFFKQALQDVREIEHPEEIKDLLASLYVTFGIESLRGIESILLGIELRGAIMKRNPNIDDVLVMVKYALRHRTDEKLLNDILKGIQRVEHEYTSKAQLLNVPLKHESKATFSANTQAKNTQNLKDTICNQLASLYSYLKKGSGDSISPSYTKSVCDPKNMQIQAPFKKALSLSELELKEYVKTEEELNK